MRQKITEEMGVHKQWKKDAKNVTMDSLSEFIRHIDGDYEHDYGTIVHGMAAAMIATFSALNRSAQGGITGFQASFLGWEMITEFMSIAPGTPAKLLNMGDLLYPQYEERFMTISPETFKWIQDEARKNIEEKTEDTSPRVIKHWESIVEGTVPFGLRLSEDS